MQKQSSHKLAATAERAITAAEAAKATTAAQILLKSFTQHAAEGCPTSTLLR